MKKQITASLLSFFAFLLHAIAGGPSSTVDITKIHDVDIAADRIIIVGDIVCKTALASEARESESVTMQSTKITSAANRVRIVIIPYFSRRDIAGACMGNASQEELLKQFPELWADNWKRNTEEAKKLVKGGMASIGFQGEMISITGYEIKEVTGWGGLSAKP